MGTIKGGLIGSLGTVGIGIVILLIASLSPAELENSYTCLANGETGIFWGGISGTGLTAYPYAENNTDYVRCYDESHTASTWIPTTTYMDYYNLSINDTGIMETNTTLPVNEMPGDESYIFDNITIMEADYDRILVYFNETSIVYINEDTINTTVQIVENDIFSETIVEIYKNFTVDVAGYTYECSSPDGGSCFIKS